MGRAHELKQLTWIRILGFIREPEAMFWVFLFPVVLALVLGLAFKNRGTEQVLVGAIEGQLPETWAAALEASEEVRLVVYDEEAEALKKLRSGAITALLAGDDSLRLRYDPTRPESQLAKLRVTDVVQTVSGRVDVVEVVSDLVTEKGARYIDFLIPGLLGLNLMGTGIWATGFAIVDMRQKKVLKLLLVTPMRKTSFLFSQMLSRLLFLLLEVVVIVAFGVWVLDVPFRTDFVSFCTLALLGGLCFTGLGLLIASRANTIEGVSGVMNFVMMPMWLLSGVFFSYEKFPEFLHPFIRLLPLTALNDGLRKAMLEGDHLAALWPESLVQIVWMALAFVAALKIFRWR